MEAKLLLSASAAGQAHHAVETPTTNSPAAVSGKTGAAFGGFQLDRITQPSHGNSYLAGPFQQVNVQSVKPKPGQIYNIFSVSVRNSTARTYTASDNFGVRISGQTQYTPILTGNQTWKSGQFIVFYVLSKQYYPVQQISGGFEFNLDGSTGTTIPGPSGIFLRVKYNPNTIAKVINYIVPHGPGAKGHHLGLPDTAIWEFTSAQTKLEPL